MKVQLLCDSVSSWIIPYAQNLAKDLVKQGYEAILLTEQKDVVSGDILILLSCEQLFKKLNLNKHNLVIHESDLPKGKGWSPLTWQVLEGKHRIPVTLFEAEEHVDSGPVYNQVFIELDGTELIDELRTKQFEATRILIVDFIQKYPDIVPVAQQGLSSFYSRRRPVDSLLDISKPLQEQFNLLRVCDNERYPAYFEQNGVKYILKIYKVSE